MLEPKKGKPPLGSSVTPQQVENVVVHGAMDKSAPASPRNESAAVRKSKAQRRLEREMRESARNDSENEPEEKPGAARKRNQLENVRKFMQGADDESDGGGDNEIQIFEPKRRRADNEGPSAVLSRDASQNRGNDLRLGDLQDAKSEHQRRRSGTFVDEGDEEPQARRQKTVNAEDSDGQEDAPQADILWPSSQRPKEDDQE